MLSEHGIAPFAIMSPVPEEKNDTGGFWGSLPKEIILDHEARIEDISTAVDELDLEQLKEHVRSVHVRRNPTDASPYATPNLTQPDHMDDFTAVITATILQALPYVSWLNGTMTEWSLRLTVLRKVPGFLKGLEGLKRGVDRAWDNLMVESQRSEEVAGPLRDRFEGIQAGLGAKVTALGQRLDSMLDDLEGRAETLPEQWIDKFEELEAAYTSWVVQGERMIMGLTWEVADQSDKMDKVVLAPFHAFEFAHQPQTTALNSSPYLVSPISEGGGYFQATDSDKAIGISPADSLRRPDSPVLGDPHFQMYQHHDSESSLDDVMRGRQESVRPRQNSEFARLVDDVIDRSQDQAQMHGDETIGLAVGDDNDIITPPPPSQGHQSSPSHTLTRSVSNFSFSHPRSPPKAAFSPSRSSDLSRPRSRHRAIDIEAYKATAENAQPAPQIEEAPFSTARTASLPILQELPQPTTIQAKRAIFNGDLERKQQLLKARSPPVVRPFEHASNAFTKLFAAHNARSQPKTQPKSQPRSHSRTSSKSGSGRRSSLRNAITPASIAIRDSVGSKESSGRDFGDLIPAPSASRSRDGSNVDVSSDPQLAPAGGEALPSPSRSEHRLVAQSPSRGHSRNPSERSGRYDPPFLQPPSPFGQDESSSAQEENWPLSQGSEMQTEEISTPNDPMASDYFERLFVDSLPLSPEKLETEDAEVNPMERALEKMNRRPVASRERSLDNSMLDGVFNHTMEDIKAGKEPRYKKHAKPTLGNSGIPENVMPHVSDVDTPGSFKSAQSTPEIRDALQGGYFQAREVSTHSSRNSIFGGHSRQGSTVRSRRSSSANALDKFDLQISPETMERSIPNDEVSKPKRVSMEKRASVASIEYFARSEVKTVDIARNPSSSSSDGFPIQSTEEAEDSQRVDRINYVPNESQAVEDKVVGNRKSIRGHPGVPPSALRTDSERSVIARTIGAHKPPPLNVGVSTRRQPIVQSAGAQASDERPITPIKSRKRQDSTSSAAGDNIDRHVSSVLQGLPSKIRFSSRPSNSTPQSAQSFKFPRPADLTLAPAQTDNKTTSSPKNGDTKLYHLSTPGKTEPLKLFIRLVGENERVMVRVGGGWMDLADFLRQYAEHHGTRTLASSGVEVNEAPLSGTKPAPKTRSTPLSRPGSVLDTYSPRPDSALAKRSSGSVTSMKTPDLSSSPFVGNSSPAYVLTPTMSRPSTGESSDMEVGLGLTGRKKGELDEGKKKWVDEMISRTKAASAEKKRNGEKDKQWSDVGRVGSVRKVAFRGGAREN